MSFLNEGTIKISKLQAFAHRPALAQSKCGFENGIKNTFFIRSVSVYRELLIAAVFVVTIVQHRTSVLDKTACMCSKTSRVDNTKSVHNRPKPAVFVRTAQGLSSNQNEVAINSKSDLWRTALLHHGPNHSNLLSCTFLDMYPDFVVPLIILFRILSNFVTPLIHLNILISETHYPIQCLDTSKSRTVVRYSNSNYLERIVSVVLHCITIGRCTNNCARYITT